jgi:hypothetical protein
VAAPGARFAVGVNRDHFERHGFADWFREAVGRNEIDDFRTEEVGVYSHLTGDHADTMSTVALFGRAR